MNSVGRKASFIDSITSAFRIVSRPSGPDQIHLPASTISFSKLNAPTIATGSALTKRRNPMRPKHVPQTRNRRPRRRAALRIKIHPRKPPRPLHRSLALPPLPNPNTLLPLVPTPSQLLTPRISPRSSALTANSCPKRRPDARSSVSSHTAEVSTRLKSTIPIPQVLRQKKAIPPTKPPPSPNQLGALQMAINPRVELHRPSTLS